VEKDKAEAAIYQWFIQNKVSWTAHFRASVKNFQPTEKQKLHSLQSLHHLLMQKATYNPNFIYNADESQLNWKPLPKDLWHQNTKLPLLAKK
jgi:hypothetical protein